MTDITLYSYWRSSSSFRVRIALAYKSVAYRTEAVNLLQGAHGSEAHLARNPAGFVPVLVVDGEAVVESVAIIELLEELFPSPPLYPKDPLHRARVRALVEVVNAGTQPLQNLSVMRKVADDSEAQQAWSRHFIARGLQVFEALMAKHEALGVAGRYAYGDTLTAADCFLVPQIFNARRFAVDLTAYPRVSAAAAAAGELDAVRAAAPDAQPDRA